uniref:Spindlin a n=1 Tax=Sinocyclocheilus rhinocerous TaxID=307959 RepID=A0A673FNZ9_9TELE
DLLVLSPSKNMTFQTKYNLGSDQHLQFFQLLEKNKHLLPADRKPGEETESLVGKQVEYVTDKGVKRTGLVIYQVPAKPSVYYIKYDDDFHIHVYDLVKTT